MKKYCFVLATLCLGLIFAGCSASINSQKLFSSTFSDTTESPNVTPNDNFESKAFKTPNGETLSYKLLRPIGEKARSSYPLILVLSEENYVETYLNRPDFQTIYPSYVVIPEFQTLPELSQLLVLLGASLNVDGKNTYLLTEGASAGSAFRLLGQFPLSFTTIVLVDIPLITPPESSAMLKNRFFFFADKEQTNIVESMNTLEKIVINYGGRSTSVKVDPEDGKILQQVYEDPEFWIRIFNLKP